MKKIGLIILLSFFLCIGLHAKQWIVFFAKEGFFDGVIRQSFGHAYVGLIWEDPVLKKKILVDCFGFYPKGGIETKGLFGFMDGEMRDDVGSNREHDFAVEITEQELLYCLIVKRVWASKKYCLMANNCIDFMRGYCEIIRKLKIPGGFFLLPSTFINALRDENEKLERRAELHNVVEMDKGYMSKFGFIKRQQHKINEKFKKIKFKKLKLFSKDTIPGNK